MTASPHSSFPHIIAEASRSPDRACPVRRRYTYIELLLFWPDLSKVGRDFGVSGPLGYSLSPFEPHPKPWDFRQWVMCLKYLFGAACGVGGNGVIRYGDFLKLCALWGDVFLLCGRPSLSLQIVAFHRLALRSALGS